MNFPSGTEQPAHAEERGTLFFEMDQLIIYTLPP